MAGGAGTSFLQRNSRYGSPTPTATPGNDQYKLYNTAVEQQAGDYDSIMAAYKNFIGTQGAAGQQGTYNPTTSPYQQTNDVTQSLAGLNELSRTGGYSDQGIADLRARGVSPLRSIYAGANRDIDRQRSLQGGYSPNYGALKSKMARDMSESIGGQMTKINADIAQNVATNRMGATANYNQGANTESGLRHQTGLANANIMNQAGQFNAAAKTDNTKNTLGAIQGMTSLYGTTPALSNLFGSQAMQGSQLQNQITSGQNQQGLQAISQGMAGLRRR